MHISKANLKLELEYHQGHNKTIILQDGTIPDSGMIPDRIS
jgi:hypothetical protein